MPIANPDSAIRQFTGNLTAGEIDQLVADKKLKRLQTSEPVPQETWKAIDRVIFAARPEIELRVYGFYGSVCDLRFLSGMRNVRNFSADRLMNATGIEAIGELPALESLGIGIYHLDNFRVLESVPPTLTRLSLSLTKSRKPDLTPLRRFANLQELYLEGQQNHIEVLSELRGLKQVTLRSITVPGLEFLKPLDQLRSLDIKLGGIKDLSALAGMDAIQFLELWQVRGLSDLSVISTLPGLQHLFIQSLKQVSELPRFDGNRCLRRIHLETLKSLRDLSALTSAPVLEEVAILDGGNFQSSEVAEALRIPTLRRAMIALGSLKKNEHVNAVLRERGIECGQLGEFAFH